MAHPTFKFVNMTDQPAPEVADPDRRRFINTSLNAIDEDFSARDKLAGRPPVLTPEWQKCKWAFVESLPREDEYRHGCWWIQNQ